MIGQGKISSQEAGYPAQNGRKWALCDCNFKSQCLAYYAGTWFSADSSSANYYSSKDGITWTKLTMPSGGPTTKCVSMISSTAGIFVYTETPGIVYQTENGTTWHTFAVGETDSMSLKKLYVVGDKILLLLSNGKLNIIRNWRSSFSSLTFVASNVNDLEYYNGKFVAATSTDGIIFNEACKLTNGWHGTETNMNLNYTSITHKGKYWYATQEFSNSVTGYRDLYLVYSLDCVNWTKAQVLSSNSDLILPDNLRGVFFNIEYGNGIYTATTNTSPANNGYIFTSTDGINFEQKVIDETFSSQRIKYINGVFIYGGNRQHKVKYSLNGKDLFDTNIPSYNTTAVDYIEDEHKGVIVGVFQNQLFYSLTYETQKDFNIVKSKIYGISRDISNSSPAWARTDDAVGMTATATVGTVAGSSDFDNCYPWSGIARETLSTGDVMVKIPKFYFQRYREGNVEHIRITDKATSGFTLHPAFNHGGVEKDYLYVGAYKTTSGNKSISGVSPLVDQTRATMRSNAKAKGTGWGIIDIAALSAIQMLILVEFANNNVQSVIGRGFCDNNSRALSTGTCDNVSGLTGRPAGTDGFVDVVWRGIEGFWGNVWEWVDGVNWNDSTYYVCNDPSKYADDTTMNYTALSFRGTTNWASSYITKEGLDTGSNPHVMLPSVADSGSETTYVCDACWSRTGRRVFQHGGDYNDGSFCGLFTAGFSNDSPSSSSNFGSRLLYIPS